MAVLTIRTAPDPVLFKKARKIAKIAPRHKKLTDDMVETMEYHNGVGLAANQVGVLERVAVVRTPEMEEAMVLVNPEIVRQEGEREVEEGCLSVPDIRGKVTRSIEIRVRSLDRHGTPQQMTASGFPARVIQHETDHLDGVLFLDRMTSFESLTFLDEYGRYWDKGENSDD